MTAPLGQKRNCGTPAFSLPPNLSHLLFVYGTLKTGFPNHSQMPGSSRRIGLAKTTRPYPLVIGPFSVPFLLRPEAASGLGQASAVHGELWAVDDAAIQSLDDFEGVSAGYYDRELVHVLVDGDLIQDSGDTDTPVPAWSYFRSEESGGPGWVREWPATKLAQSGDFVSCYSEEDACAYVSREKR